MTSQPARTLMAAPLSRRALGMSLSAAAILSTRPARADATWDRIRSSKSVTVGFVNNRPWSFRDQGGNHAGIEPDIMRAVFARHGVATIETAPVEFNGIIPGLQARRFDMSNGGLYITPQRCRLVAFSSPYLRVSDGILVREGNPLNIRSYRDFVDNPNLRLGTVRGSINAQNAELAGVPAGRQLLLPDSQGVISALMAGRLDAGSFSLGLALAMLQDSNIRGLQRAVPFTGYIMPNGEEKLGFAAFAFRRPDTELKRVFDEGIAALTADGTLATILGRYGFSESDVPRDISTERLCTEG
ncbi:transporter substrate-binding domain-containing protein [Roseomonas hellenica]|uniref:Transporter substrate-binding domain-containing protein n=1 Tax=Plastoroseomonas hellenica TaxID=2687306 RepID=A0ABS5F4W0_9PROT|nr:transporter substrate-binding domain-containing protein [Plastoroseomonas hellenica]MBR0667595.1 transporter substrate-binding domain-containing protein [Plastoroseomonas hellenica]